MATNAAEHKSSIEELEIERGEDYVSVDGGEVSAPAPPTEVFISPNEATFEIEGFGFETEAEPPHVSLNIRSRDGGSGLSLQFFFSPSQAIDIADRLSTVAETIEEEYNEQ